MLMACTRPVAVYFSRYARWWAVRGFSVVALAIFVVTIVKTGSRGAFLGLLAIALYMAFRFRSVHAAKRWAMIGAMVIALAVGGNDKYWDMMGSLLHPTKDYNWAGRGEVGRMQIWQRGIGYMVDHPLV